MKRLMMAVAAAAMFTLAAGLSAQAPAGAPAGSTGICKDGSYWSGASKSGACRGHKGIQTWYADAGGSAKAATPGQAASAAKPAPAASSAKSTAATPPMTAKAATGPAPAGATGICKDGSYWTGPTKSGACRGHQGIQTWYADAAGAAPMKPASMPAPTQAAAVPSRPAPTPVATPAPSVAAPTPASAGPSRQGPAAAAAAKPLAPGGGPGLVWVNTESNVYHCSGSVYYGKTKAGQYMSEAAAQAKGAHGDRGKTCAGK